MRTQQRRDLCQTCNRVASYGSAVRYANSFDASACVSVPYLPVRFATGTPLVPAVTLLSFMLLLAASE